MKALVVYDSVYGNTEEIAQAIGEGLGEFENVQVVRVGDVKPGQLAGLDVLVVGSPTQKFTYLSSIGRFLKAIHSDSLQGMKVAALDTRATPADVEKIRMLAFMARIFGYAAEPILNKLQKKGGKPLAAAEGFFVGGTEGSLIEGEHTRATQWAQGLAAAA